VQAIQYQKNPIRQKTPKLASKKHHTPKREKEA
jgi:hypothetical protein